MLQRSSRLCTGWAALPVGALVASLLGVGASTATATTDTPDERSSVNVCVGEALTDRGFTDVSDTHIFRDAINCLAHYGVTIGSGDGATFTPGGSVNRWQMMLFLARATVPANINLRAARAQNFTDVDTLNSEARNAIDLLVTNGIATPASARTFDPDGIVDRAEMALLLTRFLDAAGSVVSFNSAGDILLDANDDGSQRQPDDYFKDARDLVPVAADDAISAAYELGITTGADPTPAAGAAQPGLDFFYRPRGSVTRGQMAAFIIRTLGHTMARPKGLSAQYARSEIRVSLRDDDFEPVSDAPIDMFYIETDDANRAFTPRGLCDEVEFAGGAYPCEIDSSDLTTDNDGEVSLTVPDAILDGTDTTVWVWTGRDGDEVGRGTDLIRLDVEPSTQAQGASTAKISTAFRGSKARFGTTVTFTVQLQDARGNDVSTGTGQGPAEWELTTELLVETTVDGDADDTGERIVSKTPRTVRSDSSGRITFSVSVSDPDRGSIGQSRTRTYKLVPGTNAPTVFVADRDFDDAHYLEFSDAPSDLDQAVVTLTTPNPHINAPASGSARNTAVVSVFNEYGEAIPAATAIFASDKSTITNPGPFRVGGDGVRRFSYSYDGAGGEIETLTVTVDPDGDDDTDNSKTPPAAHVFWSVRTSTRDTSGAKKIILFGDTDRNEIIVDIEDDLAGSDWPVGSDSNNPATVPESVVYDGLDRFDVQGAGDSAPKAVTIEEFEKALAGFLAKSSTSDDGTGGCLEWTNYDPGRSRPVTEFKLWRTCS